MIPHGNRKIIKIGVQSWAAFETLATCSTQLSGEKRILQNKTHCKNYPFVFCVMVANVYGVIPSTLCPVYHMGHHSQPQKIKSMYMYLLLYMYTCYCRVFTLFVEKQSAYKRSRRTKNTLWLVAFMHELCPYVFLW